MYLKSCWFHGVERFYIKVRFYETFIVTNSITWILLTEAPSNPITIKWWFILYLHIYVLGYCKFRCFVYPAYNLVHNILNISDGWANLPFATSERSVIISNKLVYTSCLTSCWTT